MAIPVSSQQDFYDIFQQAVESRCQTATDWSEGSILDGLAGAGSLLGAEFTRTTILEFNKTFIDLANGPATTGGPDDLQTLALDHYGAAFARPSAIAAIDTVTFTRATNAAGQITIPKGTVVQTQPDANGNVQQYTTNADVIMTNTGASSDTSVSVGVTAIVAGAAGSAASGTIDVIESPLLDATIACSNSGNSTGEDALDDIDYREFIRNLIESISGATIQAIEAKALTVAGVKTATAIETSITVIQYNPANSTTIGKSFPMVTATLYVADSTGTASVALQQAVRAALGNVSSCGVYVNVQAATGQTVNWTATYTLNPSGPNYSTFVNDPTTIRTAMTNYINNLPVGIGFTRTTANAAILAIYGASGTNDLTAFTTSTPSGDIAGVATTKLVAGTVTTT